MTDKTRPRRRENNNPSLSRQLGTPDAQAINRREDRVSLYAARKKTYPRRVYGVFRMVKWAVMSFALTVYYGLPWLRYDRGADLPNQAVLIDVPSRKAYVFGVELWAQEVYFATGLLVLAALALFLATSVAGRVWCGYACPQTVWTDLFVHIERWIQGDRAARMRLDKAPWGPRKVMLKASTHMSWLVVSLMTGGAMILYFHDAPSTVAGFMLGEASLTAYVFAALLTATTYLLGGIAREQVCFYMCPWPRIQGALVDDKSLLVSYDRHRGEKRGKYRKGESFDGRGDCIDCNQCVAVCPMGIDIRDGFQMECIQCALCIDACNDVMRKIDRPISLIRYATLGQDTGLDQGRSAERGTRLKAFLQTALRTRTYIYMALMLFVAALMTFALVSRTDFLLTAEKDRNPLYVMLSGGEIRNGYALHMINRQHVARPVRISAEGLDGLQLARRYGAPGSVVEAVVPQDGELELKLFITAPRSVITKGALPSGKGWITLKVQEEGGAFITSEDLPFNGPKR